MADNNKVTIDADYFAELYGYKEKYDDACVHCGQCQTDGKLAKAEKDRDELKAKLDEVNRTTVVCLNDEVDALKSKDKSLTSFLDDAQTKLESAERCIEDIAKIVFPNEKYVESSYKPLCDIIRAYREANEEVK